VKPTFSSDEVPLIGALQPFFTGLLGKWGKQGRNQRIFIFEKISYFLLKRRRICPMLEKEKERRKIK